jgi:hypothetical protein
METVRRVFSKWLIAGSLGLVLLCLGLTILPILATAEELSLAPGISLVPTAGWEKVRPRAGQTAVLELRAANGRIVARATVFISNRRTADNAIAQLSQMPGGGSRPTVSDIAGWPSVTVTSQIQPDEPESSENAGVPESLTRIDTFVAIDKTLVRVSITLGTKPSPDVIKNAYAFAKGLRTSKTAPMTQTRRSLQNLRTSLRAKTATRVLPFTARSRNLLSPDRPTTLEPRIVTGIQPGRELEIAVSADGQNIVIVSNKRLVSPSVPNTGGQIFTSIDGGSTFLPPVDYPLAPRDPGATEDFERRSDLSVVRGPSGRFYVSFLGREHFPAVDRDTVSIAVSEAQDHGQNFSFLKHAARCEDDDVFTTDQPHLAVDPRVRPGQNDQIYVGWRANQPKPGEIVDCNGAAGKVEFHTMLSCSADGGQTWTRKEVDNYGMYPRVTVGPDGMVYVISETDRGRRKRVDPITGLEEEVDATMWLSKFSSCESGLELQTGFPAKVTDFVGVARLPGLDRNDNGNILPSPTVAVTSARNVFVAYAEETADGNDDIIVLGSTEGGEDGTWSLRTTANGADVPARRFMPWLCAAPPDQLFVSWYDRRDATATANDLTKYFVSFVETVDTNNDTVPDQLRALEASLSAEPDPQCIHWPFATRNRWDAERCSASRQPLLAGQCCVVDADEKCTSGGSRTRCDFSDTPGVGHAPCLAGESCAKGGGHPKYGDYTGNTCLPWQAFLTWASATNPVNGTPLGESNVFFAKAHVVSFSTPKDLCAGGRCGTVTTRNLGDLELNCPDSDCRLVVPVTDICQRVVNCPGCGPDGRCPQEYSFEVTGVDRGWGIRLVDERGQAVPGTVRRIGSRLAITLRPEQSPTIKNSLQRYTLVLERNRPGKKGIAARMRVTATR